MRVALVQEDGKMPNLALMSLSAALKLRGDSVRLFKYARPWGDFDAVYSSKIFKFSRPVDLPEGSVRGGTGSGSRIEVDDVVEEVPDYLDYSIYPEVAYSIGFTQRGCRLSCDFCVVPQKEGRPKSAATIGKIWRGEGHPKDVVLLDNDFFGNPEWRDRVAEVVEGGFRVNLSQGINARILNDEQAKALASMRLYDVRFHRRSLYTAWDQLGDEKVFFRGAERLFAAGVPPAHVVVYMLVGFDPEETWEKVLHRHRRISEAGMFAYPMVYDRSRLALKRFQKWAVRRYCEVVAWPEFRKTYFRKDVHDPLDEDSVRPDAQAEFNFSPQTAAGI